MIQELVKYSKNLRAFEREKSIAPISPILLVLSPTRELALQIAEEAKTLLTFHNLDVVSIGNSKHIHIFNISFIYELSLSYYVVGGVDVGKDIRALAKPHNIIVATP